MNCFHVNQLGKLSPPATFSKVYKDECCLCFDSPGSENGINVCLTCFHGGCMGAGSKEHCLLHFRKAGHALAVNIRQCPEKDTSLEQQPNKLVRVEVKPQEMPEYNYHVVCLACGQSWDIDDVAIQTGRTTIDSIIAASSAKRQIEVQAWQEEPVPCEHARNLHQEKDTLAARLRDKNQCGQCDLRENLWMCLSCGAVGCGRRQYDRSGGNGHGVAHFEATRHPLAVKLGTIAPEGTADVHCYVCDELCIDPNLAQHLATFGIDICDAQRTEKTMAELVHLQLEQNLKFDFSMVTEDGRELQPVSGAGRTGLNNLGNSCYLSSVMQIVMAIPSFKRRYFEEGQKHIQGCQKDPALCLYCQLAKLADGLHSARYHSIAPWMFKAAISTGHTEFSTARQQDACEFFAFLLRAIQRSDPTAGEQIMQLFTFTLQQTITCTKCGTQKHQNHKATQIPLQIGNVLSSPEEDITLTDRLPLDRCLERFFEPEAVQLKCEKCDAVEQTKVTCMTSMPEYLVISLSRYIIRNWVPHKIEMPITAPFAGMDMVRFQGKEEKCQSSSPASTPPIDQSVLTELMAMGFTPAKCKRALLETGNVGIEAAMNWILEHEDEVEFEEVTKHAETNRHENGIKADRIEVPMEKLQLLIEAGFSKERAEHALRETTLDVERAFDWLLSHEEEQMGEDKTIQGESSFAPLSKTESVSDSSALSTRFDLMGFVSHKGPSVHCGHYIAHVLLGEADRQWIMFNDERVVRAEPDPPATAAEKAYMYIYRRCH